MELAYTSLRNNRLNVSVLGVTASVVSSVFFVLPCAGLAASFYFSSIIRSSTCNFSFLNLVRAVINAQNALFFVLPAVGLIVGLVGIASSGKRCVLSAVTAAFNGLMLMLMLTPGF